MPEAHRIAVRTAWPLVFLAVAAFAEPPQTPSRRAVVIGIDAYVSEQTEPRIRASRRWSNLRGAVNDARAVARLLEDAYGFDVLLLLDGEATRDAIVSAVENHLIAPAEKGDQTAFYFAGHGSQVTNSKSTEPDKRDETLVPVDAVRGRPDIRDKELRRLFNRLLDRGARLTVILDSCHSGSGVRGLPADRQARYIKPLPEDVADGKDPGPPLEEREALILSAAQDDQRAWEIEDERHQYHGAFTLSLLRAHGNASPEESANHLFLRARTRLRAEGFQQHPVMAGPREMRSAPLFGLAARAWQRRAGVLDVADDGRIILQGGWASGLSPGSELRRVERDPSRGEIQARIETAELTRSHARLIGDDVAAAIARVAVGDLFELTRWAVPDEASLRVFLPSTDASSRTLLALAGDVAGLAEDPRIQWLEDPVAETPTHILSWRADSWHLRQGGREKRLGRELDLEDLRRKLHAAGGEVRFFAHFPLPSELGSRIRLGDGTPNDAVSIVSEPSRASYLLVGRLRQGSLEYAWVRPEVVAGDAATSSLPIRSDWLAFRGPGPASEMVARKLEGLALRLGKIRAWLTLEPPRTDIYPYRLTLKNDTTRQIRSGENAKPGSHGGPPSHERLVSGERYGLWLRAGPQDLRRPFDPLYVYAFFIDSFGRSRLLFPRAALGSVENLFPRPSYVAGDPPREIPIGAQPLLEITGPWGIDTYFLLTTSEPLTDPYVLESEGVQTPNLERTHPLVRLLRNRGATRRTGSFLVPTTWSLQRISFEVVPDRKYGRKSG